MSPLANGRAKSRHSFQTRLRRLNYEVHAVAEAEKKIGRDNK